MLWKLTHLRQPPNRPSLCQCLRSALSVCVWGGKNYTADEAVNRHKKSELRVGYSLTHWGQTFKTRHVRLSKSGTADYRINENILL